MALGPAPGQRFEEYLNLLRINMPMSRIAAFARVGAAECLVIDEISMLPGRIIDYLDFHCREIRNSNRPFGGIQIVAVGDFLQLPPVAKNGKYDWAFASEAWRGAGFKNAYLTQIHRQKEPEFTEALNSFREGCISNAVANTLASRVKMFVDRSVVRLMTHNAQVDKWNDYNIGEIEKPEIVFEAIKDGTESETAFLIKNMITPEVLTLKEGARVMVTSNLLIRGGKFFDRFDENSYKEWKRSGNEYQFDVVNGQCGKVTGFGNDSVFVLIDGSKNSIEICRNTWVFDPSRDSKKEIIINGLGENQIRLLRCGSVRQIPLRPAYALTIHKSQGLTLNSAHIDIRAAREPGQAYVALSRLRELRGLYLKDWIKGVHVSEAAINFYKNLQ
jgi:ATP-dependent exoDNAse (exonuclease V) alpha subunit